MRANQTSLALTYRDEKVESDTAILISLFLSKICNKKG
jgi:hypothetical protein